MPTLRAAAFMKTFGLTYPIVNAGMGSLAGPDLAIAVSNAGGLGATGLTGGNFNEATLRAGLGRIRAATKRLFAVNYLLAYGEPKSLPVALDAGAPVVQFAWGIPTAEHIAAVRGAGAKMGIQVGSPDGAKRALDAGADYLICQGLEAGGHVQSTMALSDYLPRAIEEAKSVPVLAAGGISHGSHIRRVLVAGASGVLVGTRFVATQEAFAHDEYKAAITRATASDTVMTVCFQDGWPNAPHRVLRNRTLTMWEAAGCPPPGQRPGEGDVLTTNAATGATRIRYRVGMPAPNDRGAVLEMGLFAGMGVDAIRDIPSAGEIVVRLWKECVDAR